MTWRALNHACQSFGAPSVDYDRFAQRWDADPVIQDIVDRFDHSGLVIKTTSGMQEPAAPEEKESGISKIAKKVAKNAF